MEQMKTDEQLEAGLDARMRAIPAMVAAGDQRKALDIVHALKQEHPKNIFLIALEKQLEKIAAFASDPGLLDPSHNQELIQSLPGLIQRASEQLVQEVPTPPQRAAVAEREAAFKKLKAEYFQLADRHLAAGEHQLALQEIKRVLILDPQNPGAHDYEARIQVLIESAAAREAGKQAAREAEKAAVTPTPQHREKRAPEAPKEQPQPVYTERKVESAERKSKAPLIAIIAAVVVLAGGGVGYVMMTPDVNSATPEVAQKPAQQAEQRATQQVQKQEPKPVPASTPEITPIEQKSIAVDANTKSESVTPEQKTPTKSDTAAGRPSPKVDQKRDIPEPVKTEPKVEQKREIQEPVKTEPKAQKEVIQEKPAQSKLLAKAEEAPKKMDASSSNIPKADVKIETPSKPAEEVHATVATYIEKNPEVVKLESPRFPLAAQRVGIDGEVVVRALIGTDGKVKRAEVLKSSNDIFNEAVLEAVNQSRFSPGVKTTGPSETWITIPFRFKARK
jgi:periplasmic protein TonB